MTPICVIDSGVNEIPQLYNIIIERNRYPSFQNSDDEADYEGHGAPIAFLAAFGEVPGRHRANIISYKIYSEENPYDAYKGMLESITLYSQKSKIFTSSINFEVGSSTLFAKLDKKIQENNICFISSAGNIDPDQIRIPYPEYFLDFPILPPAQNIDVLSVGAFSLKTKAGSVAKSGGLAPFTRCFSSLVTKCEINKPDIVEHGGNWCAGSFDSRGIGVCTYEKDGSFTDELTGTSFAAPLIAGRIAELYNKYYHQISNCETLKALLYSSCKKCGDFGFGYGIPDTFLTTKKHRALYFTEGEIQLSDLTPKGEEHVYLNKIEILVPDDVREIQAILVHSDNYHNLTSPDLETYLKIEAKKTGRRNVVPPLNTEDINKITNVKEITWKYKIKSMGGIWTFSIIPESVGFFDYETRNNIKVRYGFILLLTANIKRDKPLVEDIIIY